LPDPFPQLFDQEKLPMKSTRLTWIALLLAASLAACTSTSKRPVLPEEVPEIGHGLVQGYLSLEEQLDSKLWEPPAPAKDSPRQALDDAISANAEALRGSDRWELAARDADLSFPAAPEAFSCTLGIRITKDDTPWLYMLLRRTMTDLGLSPYAAKNFYNRERPFMAKGDTTCTPGDEAALRSDGSYPSGHTAIGWGWALILTELQPDLTDGLIARGRAFGESRNVCNAHWYSDVVAGRSAGAAAVAKLHSKLEFREAMEAARTDIERARQLGLAPTRDCAAETEALTKSIF
jgi:acid phosphatase (class A)